MKVKLKQIEEQVVVITGASSGIGLTTAKRAAQRGARVVLAARDEESLRRGVEEIREAGGEAVHAVADVADLNSVREVAALALREFGRIDTWINNAGVSIYGPLEKVSVEDARRLFDTNYWGVVHGSLVAVEHLRQAGGALINIGSVLSDRAIPLQGHYSASKHAVKGFTDALRMELEKEGVPISVTLVKPSSIATPYPEHAKNYMEDAEPTLPPPVYAPEVVADTILRCAERPVRDISVGAGGRMLASMGNALPRLTDRYMEVALYPQQKAPKNGSDGSTNLHGPVPRSGHEYGHFDRHVMKSSLYTQAMLHPALTFLGMAAVGLGLALASRLR